MGEVDDWHILLDGVERAYARARRLVYDVEERTGIRERNPEQERVLRELSDAEAAVRRHRHSGHSGH